MKATELNKLIARISTIKSFMSTNKKSGSLEEWYKKYCFQLKHEHGAFMNELLFELQYDYCKNKQVKPIEKYIADGVDVESNIIAGKKAKMFLRYSPLRVVLTDPNISVEKVLWQVY